MAETPQRARRVRIGAALAASALVHLGVAVWLARMPRLELAARPQPVELEIVAQPPPPPEEPAAAPEPAGAPQPTRPSKRAPRGKVAQAPSSSVTPEPGPASPSSVEIDGSSLLRMRGGPTLIPDADTLARALGPEEAPAPSPRPGKRPRKIPGTGLTSYLPDQDDNVKKGMAHPRAFDVLAGIEKMFHVDKQRVEDELRGDLSMNNSIKRWLFGSLGGDPEAMRNQVPWLACLVCVTLRPSHAPEVEVVGTSGSAWFDRAASESVEVASKRALYDDDFPASRACFHFAARLYRNRPDITNLLSVPFMLQLETRTKLISFSKLGG